MRSGYSVKLSTLSQSYLQYILVISEVVWLLFFANCTSVTPKYLIVLHRFIILYFYDTCAIGTVTLAAIMTLKPLYVLLQFHGFKSSHPRRFLWANRSVRRRNTSWRKACCTGGSRCTAPCASPPASAGTSSCGCAPRASATNSARCATGSRGSWSTRALRTGSPMTRRPVYFKTCCASWISAVCYE